MDIKEIAKFEVSGNIGIITLDDPPANELQIPEFVSIERFGQWCLTPGLKGMIIRGSGKNFSAGGNPARILENASDQAGLSAMMEAGHRLLSYISNMDLPVIAAINRVCFGGGLEIALACHIRVASVNALLAFPEVNLNLMPGLGGTQRLPRLGGMAAAADLVLGGSTINAAEAKVLGIIDHLAPKDEAFEYSMKLMHRMTHDRPLHVIRAIMQSLRNAATLPLEEAIRQETMLFCSLARMEAERRKREEA